MRPCGSRVHRLSNSGRSWVANTEPIVHRTHRTLSLSASSASPQAVHNSQLYKKAALVTDFVLLSLRAHWEPIKYPTSHPRAKTGCCSKGKLVMGTTGKNTLGSVGWRCEVMGDQEKEWHWGRQDFQSYFKWSKGAGHLKEEKVLYGKKHYLLCHLNLLQVLFIYLFLVISVPNVRLELTTWRSSVVSSSDRASQPASSHF